MRVCPPSTWRQPDDVHFLWLPVRARSGEVLLSASYQVGFVTYVDGRVPKIVENLPSIQPTIMAGVPRVFRRSTRAPMPGGQEGSGAKAKIFDWAFKASTDITAKQRQASSPGPPPVLEWPGRQIGLLQDPRTDRRTHEGDDLRLGRAQR